jgi:hypothetical protein
MTPLVPEARGFDAGDPATSNPMSERDPQDPAWQPVEEAGGGESEGFEQAEQELIEHAEHGDDSPDPREHAFPPEQESDRETAEYGEADQEGPPDTA